MPSMPIPNRLRFWTYITCILILSLLTFVVFSVNADNRAEEGTSPHLDSGLRSWENLSVGAYLSLVVNGYADPSPGFVPTSTPSPAGVTLTPTPTPSSTPLPTLEPLPTSTATLLPSPTPSPTIEPDINLGVDKPASESSAVGGSDASFALDGNIDGDFGNGSVFQTAVEDDPWWQVGVADTAVSLNARTQPVVETSSDVYRISRIVIHNRTDCCQENLADLHLFVSNEDLSGLSLDEILEDESVWKYKVDGEVGDRISIPVGETGRYVKIQLEGDDKILALAEVQIFGRPESLDQSVLHIGRGSARARAIESTGEQAVYVIRRYGNLEAATYPFSVIGQAAEDTAEPNPMLSFLKQETGLTLSSRVLSNESDYRFKDEDGNLLNGAIVFEDGQSSAQLVIEAVDDGVAEVPELLLVEFDPQPNLKIRYAREIRVTLVDDRRGFGSDGRLFVGQFEPENSADTNAFGYVTVRLSGDNSYGTVNVSFSGLTTEQTAAHIHIGNPFSGPIAESLPMGQIENYRWDIEAASIINNDQGMLDALLSGGLYVNIHSADYPGGEIRATLVERTGSVSDDPIVHPMPAYETLTGEALEQDIYRFLTQATFGPTPELVADLKARIEANGGDRIAAYDAWIDEQLQMQSPSHIEYYIASRKSYVDGVAVDALNDALRKNDSIDHGLTGGWLTAAMYSKAQLRERTAFALSEILVVAASDNDPISGLIDYSDMLKQNAFANYDLILNDVSRHYSMGIWLSHFQNRKTVIDPDGNITASPDENYAREIMQLFSIGLLKLQSDGTLQLGQDGLPIETYTQDDISELARVFTGWGTAVRRDAIPDGKLVEYPIIDNSSFSRNPLTTRQHIYTPGQWAPMKNFPDFHDQGRKEVLGYVFPPGIDGETELNQVVDILANHPNTAPFIAYRMIQRMTTSNPSPGYVYRVSAAYTDSNGNMGEVVRAILLDPEARNLAGLDQVGVGKVREPLIQMVGLCRLLSCTNNQNDAYPLSALVDFGLPSAELDLYEADAARIFISSRALNSSNTIRQAPFRSPTVFNWFQPDYAPAGSIAEGGLTSPELQHINEAVSVSYFNLMYNINNNPNGINGLRPRDGQSSAKLRTAPPQEMIDAYMAVMDSDGNGTLDSADDAFQDDAQVREAVTGLVDFADDYLCNGWLQAQSTGNQLTDPREIIITGVVAMLDHLDGTNASNAVNARTWRIQETLLAVMVTPQCTVAK